MSEPRSYGVVPAAGHSSRMGLSKLLIPWRQSTVIDQVLSAWLTSDVTRTVVVVRADDDSLLALCRCYDVDLVVPEPAPADMKQSVQAALRHIAQRYSPADRDVWLLAPADLPRLSSTIINQLLHAYRSAEGQVVVPVHSGRRGHPVAIPWTLAGEVLDLALDVGINSIWKRIGVSELAVAGSSILEDINTPEDAARVLSDPVEGSAGLQDAASRKTKP